MRNVMFSLQWKRCYAPFLSLLHFSEMSLCGNLDFPASRQDARTSSQAAHHNVTFLPAPATLLPAAFLPFYISRENAFSSNKTTNVHKQKWLTVQLHLPASFYITWENITKQKPPANCCGWVAVRAQGRPPRPHWTLQGNSSGYEAQYSCSALVKSYCQERPSSLRNTASQNITASISVSSER